MISIIAVVSRNGVIGRGGDVPPELDIPEDKMRFARITRTGTKTVIVGRKTEESIERRLGKPLPGRKTIMLTSNLLQFLARMSKDPMFQATCAIDDFMPWWKELGEEVFVIGGAEVYKHFLPHADKLYLTVVNVDIEGDTFFPEWNRSEWDRREATCYTDLRKPEEGGSGLPDYSFETYVRKPKAPTGRLQHMGNTRNDNQRRKMLEAMQLGECPFCLLDKYHDNPVEWEGKYWTLTANDDPYDHVKLHLLAISKAHFENIEELDPQAGAELVELVQRLKKERGIKGGALFMRFGDENCSGGTIPHLHAHLVVPDTEAADYQPVPCWVGARREVIDRLRSGNT